MIDLSGTVHVGTTLLPGVEAAINKEGSTNRFLQFRSPNSYECAVNLLPDPDGNINDSVRVFSR